MSPKIHPTTIRLSEEDQSFLAGLALPGATTISDKLRALIHDRRLQHEAARDYKAALSLSAALLGPLQESVRLAENRYRMHSELIARLLDWTSELLASLLADHPADLHELPDRTELLALEDALAERLTRMMGIVLQSYLARDTALYGVETLTPERLAPLRRLCQLAEQEQ